ncbi:MAG: hypothetical protein ACOC6H_02470 [Thermoproteota archaeon]
MIGELAGILFYWKSTCKDSSEQMDDQYPIYSWGRSSRINTMLTAIQHIIKYVVGSRFTADLLSISTAWKSIIPLVLLKIAALPKPN